MTDDYPWAVLADLVERFGSVEAAEEEAKSRAGIGEEIRRIDGTLAVLAFFPSDDPRDAAQTTAELRTRRRGLVMAALGVGPQDADSAPSSRRKPIPHATLEAAVRLLTDSASRNKVARETGLSKRQVDGLIRDMRDAGLGWNDADRLAVPAGTRATPDGYVLPERR